MKTLAFVMVLLGTTSVMAAEDKSDCLRYRLDDNYRVVQLCKADEKPVDVVKGLTDPSSSYYVDSGSDLGGDGDGDGSGDE